jgi:hypothetical protein
MVWEHNTNIAEYCHVRKLVLQTYAHSQLLEKFPNIPVVTHKQQAANSNSLNKFLHGETSSNGFNNSFYMTHVMHYEVR